MLKCEGTSKEEALENQRLRECIGGQKWKITLDTVKAFSHVRNVLNDLRRKK